MNGKVGARARSIKSMLEISWIVIFKVLFFVFMFTHLKPSKMSFSGAGRLIKGQNMKAGDFLEKGKI